MMSRCGMPPPFVKSCASARNKSLYLLVQHLAKCGIERRLHLAHALVVHIRRNDGGQRIATSDPRQPSLRVDDAGVVDPALVVVEIGAVLGRSREPEGVVHEGKHVVHRHLIGALAEHVLVHDGRQQTALSLTPPLHAHVKREGGHRGAERLVEAQHPVGRHLRVPTLLHGVLVDAGENGFVGTAALHDGGGNLDGIRLEVSRADCAHRHARARDHLIARVREEQLHGVAELVEERFDLRVRAEEGDCLVHEHEGLAGTLTEGQVRRDDALRVRHISVADGWVLHCAVRHHAASLDGVHGGGAALPGVGEEVQVQISQVPLR